MIDDKTLNNILSSAVTNALRDRQLGHNEPPLFPPAPPPIDPPGRGGDDDPMDPMKERLQRLEGRTDKVDERLGSIDLRLAKLETRSEAFATKADVSDAKVSIIMWVVGTIVVAQILPQLPAIIKGVIAAL